VIDPGETVVFSLPWPTRAALPHGRDGQPRLPDGGRHVLDGASAYADIPSGAPESNAGDTLSFVVSDTLGLRHRDRPGLNVTTGAGELPRPGPFRVGSKTITTENLTGHDRVVPDDGVNPGIYTTPAAASGTIRGVSVDVT